MREKCEQIGNRWWPQNIGIPCASNSKIQRIWYVDLLQTIIKFKITLISHIQFSFKNIVLTLDRLRISGLNTGCLTNCQNRSCILDRKPSRLDVLVPLKSKSTSLTASCSSDCVKLDLCFWNKYVYFLIKLHRC